MTKHWFNINKNEIKHAEFLGLKWHKEFRCRFIDSDHENFQEVMKIFGEAEISASTAKGRKLINPHNPTDYAKIGELFNYINAQKNFLKNKINIELGYKKPRKKSRKNSRYNEVKGVLREKIYIFPSFSKRQQAIAAGAKQEVLTKIEEIIYNGEVKKVEKLVKGNLFIWSNDLYHIKKLVRFIPIVYFKSIGIDQTHFNEIKRINHKFKEIAIKLIGKKSTYDQRRITVANYFATERFIP